MKTLHRVLWSCVDLILLLLIGFQVAYAQTLLPVQSEGNWIGIGIALAAGAAIVGIVWFIRANPGAKAKAEAQADALKTDLGAVAAGLAEALHKLTEAHASVAAALPIPAIATDKYPIPPALGKSGVAGTFMIQVTGDPKVDVSAINAQYFG